jgi:hypothetical protein
VVGPALQTLFLDWRAGREPNFHEDEPGLAEI